MIKLIKYTSFSLLLLLCLTIYSGLYFDIPRDDLIRKYAIGPSKFLELNDGSKIHYRDEGAIDKPVIVLLHGFNGSLFNFEKMVPFLIEDFRLISIDLPGFGLTGVVPTDNYSTLNSIHVISEVLERLEIKNFSIAGNSMGGGIAWRYAIQHPQKIQYLFLLSSSGVYNSDEIKNIEKETKDSPLVWKLMRSDFISTFLSYYTPKFFASQGLKSSVYDSDLATPELASQFHELTLMKGSREAILSRFSSRSYRNENVDILAAIKAPTLIIHGQEDNIIPFSSSINLNKHIKNSELKIYTEVGHLPMYEAPENTANDIKKFIESRL